VGKRALTDAGNEAHTHGSGVVRVPAFMVERLRSVSARFVPV
jgi:hypothetical protein